MRFPALTFLTVALLQPLSAQTALQLRWELKEDVFDARGGASKATFTLTNQDGKALPAKGWAIYYSALQGVRPETVKGGVQIQELMGDLYRIVPGPSFQGLKPGKTIEIEYLTHLISNVSVRPAGAYIVFDEEPSKGHSLDFKALPFTRPDQKGHDPRIVSPQAQFDRNAAIREVPASELPLFFPTPIQLTRQEGSLRLAGRPIIQAGAGLESEAQVAAKILESRFPKAGSQILKLEIGSVKGQTSPEAYELIIEGQGIHIRGNSAAGVFYGIQSLRGLLQLGGDLPYLQAVDAPRFGYRGMHLDVARNFQSKAGVMRVLELMASLKLNVLHFHLTDDEGWRLEIPGLPELTQVGVRHGHAADLRTQLTPAWGSGAEASNPYGSGYLSRTDYIEVLRQAARLHIEVIPELEMPGHARAAVKAMDARAKGGDASYRLSDPADVSTYTSVQGYPDNVMNPALPSTFAFIQKVVNEVVAMHKEAGLPLRNLHMGGDEVPGGVWEKSPQAQAFAKAQGFKTTEDFWFHFYGKVAEILKVHGLPLSGWEEIGLRKTQLDGRGKFIPNPTFANSGWKTYVWNNTIGGGAEDLPYRLANAGYQVVLCPVSNLYFDLAVNRNPEEPGLAWGGYVDVDKPFEFIPFDYYRNTKVDGQGNPVDRSLFMGKDRLTEFGRRNILGMEGCLWSETLGGEGRLDYMLAPKIFGLAERAWAPDPAWAAEQDPLRAEDLFRADWSRFANLLGKRELPRIDREFPGFTYRIPTPGLKVVEGQVHCNLFLPGFTLRYTVDGSEPTSGSPEVRGPINAQGIVRVAAFDTTGRKGHTASLDTRKNPLD